MDQAKDALSSGAAQIGDAAKNVDMQKLLPYLLAGGAGAVGGAALSGRRKERQGETRGQYLTRILRNAVGAGALTGLGTYAVGQGLQKTLGKVDVAHPISGSAADQGPLASGGRQALFGLPAATISGATGLGLTAGMKGIGANPNAAAHGDDLLALLKSTHNGAPPGIDNLRDLKARSVDDPGDFLRMLRGDAPAQGGMSSSTLGSPAVAKQLRYHANGAGINPYALGSFEHKIFEAGKIPSMVMGRTSGRRFGRGAIGLGAALIPALAGSLLTDHPE